MFQKMKFGPLPASPSQHLHKEKKIFEYSALLYIGTVPMHDFLSGKCCDCVLPTREWICCTWILFVS